MASLTTISSRLAGSRQSLLIAVAVLLAAMALLRAGYSWYSDLSNDLDSSYEIKEEQYERLNRLLAGANDYRNRHKSLQNLEEDLLGKHLITGDTPSLADAAFQNFITDVSKRTNVPIRVMKSLPDTERDSLHFLNINISARAEIGNIRDFLIAVRNSGKYVFFTEIEIQLINAREQRFYNFNAKLTAMTQP